MALRQPESTEVVWQHFNRLLTCTSVTGASHGKIDSKVLTVEKTQSKNKDKFRKGIKQ